MDKLSKKPKLSNIPAIDTDSFNMDSFSKWMPFICAGSAIGLSIFVLKELKKTKEEIHTLKKIEPNLDPEVSKKLSDLEKQMKTITEYIKNSKKSPIIKKAVVIDPEPTVIINSADDSDYEEIEVTDDES